MLGVALDEREEVAPMINRVANALKHGRGDADATVDFEEEARDALDPAIRNYRVCTGTYPSRVADFDATRPR